MSAAEPLALPLYVWVAIQRLQIDATMRTPEQLDRFIDTYARVYGEECPPLVRFVAHEQARARWLLPRQPGDGKRPADVNLALAAPALLEACKGAAIMLRTTLKQYEDEPWAKRIAAAIASAEGE